jgi:prostaglandin-endoperoxide synthase 2
MNSRSKAKDGYANRLELYLATHFGDMWRFIEAVEPLRRRVNRQLINRAILRMPTRPYSLSTMAPYTSWASLTDRTFDGRHLPPVTPSSALPPVERVAELFVRRGPTRLCSKSTVLFPYFAQWFTDGLRGDRSLTRDPPTKRILS